jgi:hypothetical protein
MADKPTFTMIHPQDFTLEAFVHMYEGRTRRTPTAEELEVARVKLEEHKAKGLL